MKLPFSPRLGRFLLSSLAGLFVSGAALNANAAASGSASLSMDSLSISSSDGTVVYDPLGWSFSTFSESHNSNGEDSSQFDDVGDAGAYGASSLVVWANGAASVNASLANISSWTASVSSSSSIPDGAGDAHAWSGSQASLYAFSFMIMPPDGVDGDVTVTVSANITATDETSTSNEGVSAQAQTTFSLDIDGDPLIHHFLLSSIGPNSFDSQSATTPLSNTATLLYGTPYTLIVSLDAETDARTEAPVPEASTVAGSAATALLALWTTRSRKRRV